MKQKLILASQSPRRKDLLRLITPDFDIEVAAVDEKEVTDNILQKNADQPFIQVATLLVEQLAKQKAKKIFIANPDATIIGADTVVLFKDRILGKPTDEAEAFAMLRSYFGQTHSVITGVHIMNTTHQKNFSVKTEVTFWEWSDTIEEQVLKYIRSGSPMDKAGAYGIQEMPSIWVKEVKGDYTSVIGLPISHVNQALMALYPHT